MIAIFGEPKQDRPLLKEGADIEIERLLPILLKLPLVGPESMRASIAMCDRFVLVLRMRFGFYGRSYTLQEVGRELGVTRERIRQMEHKALRMLRHPIRSHHFLKLFNEQY